MVTKAIKNYHINYKDPEKAKSWTSCAIMTRKADCKDVKASANDETIYADRNKDRSITLWNDGGRWQGTTQTQT